jgi:hypothetical protein
MKHGISQLCRTSLPQINGEVTPKEGLRGIGLSAPSPARPVEGSLTRADVIFSGTCFDLRAQQVISCTAPLPAGWDLATAQAALQVRSVYNTHTMRNGSTKGMR